MLQLFNCFVCGYYTHIEDIAFSVFSTMSSTEWSNYIVDYCPIEGKLK